MIQWEKSQFMWRIGVANFPTHPVASLSALKKNLPLDLLGSLRVKNVTRNLSAL